MRAQPTVFFKTSRRFVGVAVSALDERLLPLRVSQGLSRLLRQTFRNRSTITHDFFQ